MAKAINKYRFAKIFSAIFFLSSIFSSLSTIALISSGPASANTRFIASGNTPATQIQVNPDSELFIPGLGNNSPFPLASTNLAAIS